MTAAPTTDRASVLQRTAPLLVVATFYCTPRRDDPYYEIHLAPRAITPNPRALVVAHSHLCACIVLRTRDDALYHDALDAEGTPHRVVATWHRGDGAARLLDALDVTP